MFIFLAGCVTTMVLFTVSRMFLQLYGDCYIINTV